MFRILIGIDICQKAEQALPNSANVDYIKYYAVVVGVH